MKTRWIAIGLSAVVVVLAVAGWRATRGGYETAGYRPVRTNGKYELRDYQTLTVAETPREGNGGDNGSFRRLFRFISGKNQEQRKIAMTTPVFMAGTGTNATMAFVIPARFKASEVPKPEDPQVRVREFDPGCFAVLRFSGRRSQTNEVRALGRLQKWMQSEGLKELSPPVYAYFDPPWTPPFLRRNEVMIRTESVK